ncbi:TetR/AcrR family transcriptional regulator [Paenibacillus macerans]|uniref:TetR/AcrR family transcriptional regulator n=1 Tax=Paenibacillus macerans TaxID=44252 RepID=UPI003D312C32
MTPRTKEQNDEIRLRRLAQIRKAAADVFLDKGLALEIRDVAAAAGLGYGTVYHYYSNKGDLLNDLLWVAMDRAGDWLSVLYGGSGAPGWIPGEESDGPGSRLRQMSERNGLSLMSGLNEPNGRGLPGDPFVAAGIRLLEQWAEDHGLYLLHKLAAEDFRLLPEARALPLSEAYGREVLVPFAAALDHVLPLPAGKAASGAGRDAVLGGSFPSPAAGNAATAGTVAPAAPIQQAEMLLAALAGCAWLPLRRGTLRAEAGGIARFLLHRLEERT